MELYAFSVGGIPGVSASPSSGNVDVAGAAVNQTIAFSPTSAEYTVTFTQAGLASDTSWSVGLNGSQQNSSSSTIAFTEPNGTYAFDVGAIPGYSLSPSSGSAVVAGAVVNRTITFTPTKAEYTVAFTETRLVSGTSWSVDLNGSRQSSTSSKISFREPNGTYSFSVGAIPGDSASPSAGNAVVTGAVVTRAITFTPTKAVYAVTFTESGLTSGTSWSVDLNGSQQSSTSSTIVYSEPNGTYTFTVGAAPGYSFSPSSGNAVVTGGSVSRTITFTPTAPEYAVTFTESGLKSGTSWTVTLDGQKVSSSSATISFTRARGTYAWVVSDPKGYTTTASGNVIVHGAITVHITYKTSSAARVNPETLPGSVVAQYLREKSKIFG